jgi:hypothetical protein
MFYKEGDIEKALLRLGIDATQRRSELVALCPMHKYRIGKEDSNPSWSINADTGAHHCFSCGYKGNLLTLISDLLEYGDLEKSKSWLRSNTDVDWDLVSKQLEEAKKTYIHLPKLVPMSEARLAVFQAVPEWAARDRGLTKQSCELYGLRWRESDSTWVLPIRSLDHHKLLGWQEKGHISRRFFNRPPGIPKSKTLFGIDVWEGGQMIVVESPLDAVKLKSVGIPGGVATCGAIISSEQIEIMRRAEVLIIAMDNDEAGKKASNFLLDSFRKLGLECWFFNYGDSDKKDIGDLTPDQIDWGLTNAKHCVLGRMAISGS